MHITVLVSNVMTSATVHASSDQRSVDLCFGGKVETMM